MISDAKLPSLKDKLRAAEVQPAPVEAKVEKEEEAKDVKKDSKKGKK